MTNDDLTEDFEDVIPPDDEVGDLEAKLNSVMPLIMTLTLVACVLGLGVACTIGVVAAILREAFA